MLECPWPQARSATRAGGSARSRSSTGATAGSHSLPSRLVKSGRVNEPCASCSSSPYSSYDTPSPERNAVMQPFERQRAGQVPAGERGGVVEALLVEQDLVVAGGQREATLVRRRRRIVDLEDPGRGLLLQPLAGVALVDPGRFGQLLGGQRATLGDGRVEPEPMAQVEAAELEGRDRGVEEPLDERVAALGLGGRLGGGGRHGAPPGGVAVIVDPAGRSHHVSPELAGVPRQPSRSPASPRRSRPVRGRDRALRAGGLLDPAARGAVPGARSRVRRPRRRPKGGGVSPTTPCTRTSARSCWRARR